jgi:hypothetical protein
LLVGHCGCNKVLICKHLSDVILFQNCLKKGKTLRL